MEEIKSFVKAAPVGFVPEARCTFAHSYKYFVEGKGSLLGVLFEDSVDVYFEWLMEEGSVVPYGPSVRYRSWPKREFARLMAAGVWEPSCSV